MALKPQENFNRIKKSIAILVLSIGLIFSGFGAFYDIYVYLIAYSSPQALKELSAGSDTFVIRIILFLDLTIAIGAGYLIGGYYLFKNSRPVSQKRGLAALILGFASILVFMVSL